MGRRSPSEERATEVLAGLLEPRLPVFLELVVGAMQGRPGYQGVARRVLGGLAHELGGLLRSRRRPVEAGAAVLRGAVGSVLRGLMEPAAVGLASPSAARS